MTTDRLHDLNNYVATHTRRVTPSPGAIDVGVFHVDFITEFSPEKFTSLLFDWIDHGDGAFGDKPDRTRLAGGPSYIEWGGLIGDQTMALLVMACGAKAGVWNVITPKTLGIEGDKAAEMMGLGFIMTDGLRQEGQPCQQ